MQLSIVILTWNSEKYIGTCLQSIINSTHLAATDYEIYVVDNGSTDRTRLLLESYQANYSGLIRSILLEKNTGTTYSRNIALKRASGDYIAVMDSDMEINSETFKVLINAMENNGDAGLVAPKLTYGDGHLQKSTDQFPTITHKIYRYFFLKQIEAREKQPCEYQVAIEVDYAISAFWLFRSNLLKKIGYLDESFFYAPEDVDFCLRIWKSGQQVLYIPATTVTHYAQELSRGFVFNKMFIEHVKGLLYYFYKHRYVFSKPKFGLSSTK